jgi:hypothetical protein
VLVNCERHERASIAHSGSFPGSNAHHAEGIPPHVARSATTTQSLPRPPTCDDARCEMMEMMLILRRTLSNRLTLPVQDRRDWGGARPTTDPGTRFPLPRLGIWELAGSHLFRDRIGGSASQTGGPRGNASPITRPPVPLPRFQWNFLTLSRATRYQILGTTQGFCVLDSFVSPFSLLTSASPASPGHHPPTLPHCPPRITARHHPGERVLVPLKSPPNPPRRLKYPS